MNSLVLNPCRWVVFFKVIPGFTPSASGLRTGGLVAGGRGRAGLREVWGFRRLAPAVAFFVVVLRLAPDVLVVRLVLELFFDL